MNEFAETFGGQSSMQHKLESICDDAPFEMKKEQQGVYYYYWC